MSEIQSEKAVHIVRNYVWHIIALLRKYRVQVRYSQEKLCT